MRPRSDLATRILERTKRRTPPPGVRGDCRIYLGALTSAGYSAVRTGGPGGGRVEYGHRVVLEADGRRVPRGKVADHLCRRRACLERTHLRVATYAENNASAWVTRRLAARRRAGPVRSPKRRRNVAVARVRRTGDPQVPRPRALA